jgi:hypothetical protein
MKKNGTYSAEELQAIANKLLEDRDVTYGDEFGTFIRPEKYNALKPEERKAFQEYRKTPLKVEKPAKEEKPAKVEKPAKEEKPAKVEKPAKEEKPAKVEKPAKEEKPAKVEKPAKEEKPAKPAKVKAEKPVADTTTKSPE